MVVRDQSDPRIAKSRSAVLAAAQALLREEGPAAVTHQRVAARAGVGRATVYRHWRQPELLLQDAIAQVDLPYFDDFGGDLHHWLRRELRRLANELTLPAVARVSATLVQSAQYDAVARRQLDDQLELISERLKVALAVAGRRGGVDAEVDPGELSAHLVGPLVYRTIMQGATVSDAFIDRILQAHVPRPR